MAVRLGLVEIATYLIHKGAILTQVNGVIQNTALHEACKGHSIECVNLLLKEGSSVGLTVNSKNAFDWTPLHIAAAHGSEEIVTHLVSLNATIDAIASDGITPLCLASRNGFHKIVSILIMAGANMNAVDDFGQTSMHKAANIGSLQVIKALVESGAKLDIEDVNGLTAFDVADEVGQRECALYLWRNGCSIHSKIGFDLGCVEWRRPVFSGGPTPRYSHRCCTLGSMIYVSGGRGVESRYSLKGSGGRDLNDFYALDTTKKEEGHLVDIHHPDVVTDMVLDKDLSSPLVQISQNGLRAVYDDRMGIAKKRVGGVIANKPYHRDACVYGYFEVTVIDGGARNEVAIGLVSNAYSMEKHPGWGKWSYAYHGDDGKAFHNCGGGNAWGQMYSSGDVIGCGINYSTEEIFFSKNGKLVGVAFRGVKTDIPLFPMVGLNMNVCVEINFGGKHKKFKFNFEAEIYKWVKIEVPRLFRGLMGINAKMVSIPNDRLLFWSSPDEVVLYHTKTDRWQAVHVEGEEEEAQQMTFTHVIGDKMYSFRPSENSYMCLDLISWRREPIPTKPSSSVVNGTYSVAVGSKVMFWSGSVIHVYETENDSWKSQKMLGRKPPHEQYSCTVNGTQIFTFGGWNNRQQQNDVFVLDTEKMMWYKPHVTGLVFPRPRNNHSAVFCNNKLYCIGGWDGRTFRDDMDVLECDPIVTHVQTQLFQYCLASKSFSDLSLLAEGQELHVHKIIVYSRSKYFRDKLMSNPSITTIDMSSSGGGSYGGRSTFKILCAMMEFLYTENINLNLIGAEKFDISCFLAMVSVYLPEFTDILTERLILTRVQLPSTMFSDMTRYSWRSKLFCDITIIAANTPFPLHKAIICSRSSFFRALCASGLQESKNKIIHLNEDNPRVLEAVLEYIYTNNIELTEDIHELVIPILIAANQYSVVGCKEFMEDVIGSNLDVENVLSLVILADQQQATRLAKSCYEFVSHPQNTDLVFTHPEYALLKHDIDLILGEDIYKRLRAQHEQKTEGIIQEESPMSDEVVSPVGLLTRWFGWGS
eukprot:TRINITY_DN11360_c0_g1_i11.p1 TRINITY_DN11360_c0_g1~~TRINITY_DN11360_c0_g1_i11.p1  ORF type:complete len:1040 (-),score=219.24 TRINITY_DN11360_c0_g1_i11:222-3341(-)